MGWILYGMMVIGNIGTASGWTFFLGLLVMGFFMVMWGKCCEEEEREGRRIAASVLRYWPIVACSGLLAILIPSQKELAAIYVLPKLAQSETVNELSVATKDAALAWLKSLAPEREAGHAK